MSDCDAIAELLEQMIAIPPYEDPLLPLYEALGHERLLTLRTIRDHSRLLHDCAEQAQEQVEAIQRVTDRCRQLPPTPLSLLPLGF